ncbi:MAG: hypothetical protein A2Y10_13075 [Planctomycetes bacterium GWF2_41_51]|nr:MAG: hypothetical protein A2Y10_13075 [Planctomycetes bacterium GWF2_41_51]HBG60711.1 hypothetical protein [Candidatus Omnitrophota bacterium]
MYGWIPILTGEILFDFYPLFILSEIATKLNDSDSEKIDALLSKKAEYYRWFKATDDVDRKKAEIIISIQKNKVEDVLFIDKDKRVKAHVSCEIMKDGIVKLELLSAQEETYKKDIIQQAFIIVRNIYHSHTHHTQHEDLLLSPVESIDKKNAIGDILKQYLAKIVEYHKRIRRSIELETKINQTANLVTKAHGEMIYALNFINSFKNDINNWQSLLDVFNNARDSINVLSKDVELNYISRVNEKITHVTSQTRNLTLYLLILTVVLVVLTIVLIFM